MLCVALAAPVAATMGMPDASAGPSTWTQVDAGYYHTCGIKDDGRVYCWGSNGLGQLGRGPNLVNQPTPEPIASNFNDWTSVSAGGSHTCAIRATGQLYCWGGDTWGALGDGEGPARYQPFPAEVDGGHTDWATVTTGGVHTCARRTDGRLYCWGRDDEGQVGDGGTNTDRHSPVLIAGQWTSVSAGQAFTCGRRTTGRLYCWGRDDEGQLGNNTAPLSRGRPVEVAGNATDWAVKATAGTGGGHACARRRSGRLYCWGWDLHGAVGYGLSSADRQPTPVAVTTLATDWTVVSAGLETTCGRRSTGRLYCWGEDYHGMLGNDDALAWRGLPTLVAGGFADWRSVTVGWEHVCARRGSGLVYCWGRDEEGQLGDDDTLADATTPVAVPA